MAGLGVVFTALLGINLGIISAVKQYSIWDNLATVIGMVGVSMPSFFVGLVLIILFCQVLGILPASGYKHWYNYIMPIMTISFGSIARSDAYDKIFYAGSYAPGLCKNCQSKRTK